jgi:UDP-N-acetylmuramate dehydrogenase
MSDPEEHSFARLKRYTTLRTGGRPLMYARPRGYEGLAAILQCCRERHLPVKVMGGGSNLLADDGDLPFAVIHIRSPGFNWIRRVAPATVRVGAGTVLPRLLAYCRDAGLGGLEFLAGVPGTVGGALAGNAGAWGAAIAERFARAWVLDETGGRVEVAAHAMAFRYRSCDLGRRIITEAELELAPSGPELISQRMACFTARKAQVHPMASASAGCVFKNPPEAPAGKLLDLCGMKGMRIGGAEVSRLHANFICNVAGATSRDILELIAEMHNAVRREYGIDLELEVRHWSSAQEAA